MVMQRKADRIAARLIPWTDSPKNAGRVRLRGGRKGQPPREASHAVDVRIAISSLERAHELLSVDVFGMEKLARRENRAAAVALVAHAARALDEVLRREDEPLPDTLGTNRPRGGA
jgi:hypothetical protein